MREAPKRMPSAGPAQQALLAAPGVQDLVGRTGQPLDAHTRAMAEPRFGHDFSRVRVHADGAASASARALGAAAYTVGPHIVFGGGRYAPGSATGRSLLFHELAHVVQQGTAPSASPLSLAPPRDEAERQASAAASRASAGMRVGHLAPAPAALVMRSPLSDRLAQLAAEPRERVFDELRRTGAAPGDVDALAVVRGRFPPGTDDRWLAENLLQHGPETLWPPAIMTRRAELAREHSWAPEPGNIRAELPYPQGTDTSGTLPVVAYFFPGLTSARALVIGGIHGNEVQGARTVEALRGELARLSAAGRRPRFTTILVPILNARTHDPALSKQGKRYLPRRASEVAADPTTRARETNVIEPNRTFPAPNETYADVRARQSRGEPDLVYTGPRRSRDQSSTMMPPETRALVSLIERFRPSRIASVHAHGISTGGSARPGNDPGIFVDPARVPVAGHPGQAQDDPAGDELARRMLAAGRRRLPGLPASVQSGPANPFLGNTGATPTRYSASVPTNEGYSLGDWAPSLGINTITIEVPQYGNPSAGSGKVPKPDQLAVERMHMEVLLEAFLEVPGGSTP